MEYNGGGRVMEKYKCIECGSEDVRLKEPNFMEIIGNRLSGILYCDNCGAGNKLTFQIKLIKKERDI